MDGHDLQKARIRAGLSQQEVAERLDVTQPTVSNWERGQSTPSERYIDQLGEFLDLDRGDPGSDSAGVVSPFGEWIARTRSAKGMTRRELSRAADVSEPQIWNIETGQTRNPRRQTREKLQRALDDEPSEEALEVTESDAQIPDVGTLTDFDPHDTDDLPTDAGVYVLYDISERPIYVGESDNIRRRIRDGHMDRFWYRRPIVETAAFVRIQDQRLRRQVEATMIRFLKSNAVVNQRNVARAD
jgi:transcriptional regulator with XRE-family HTH domain